MDYDDPEVEERWCLERRDEVAAYLRQQGVEHGRVGEWPAWHLVPYVSLWAIESRRSPGWVGWWVICGDLPTDYVSADAIRNPRDAMAAIAGRWREAAAAMAGGHGCSVFSMGSPADWPTLAPQLRTRAELLQDWVDDASLWGDA